MNWNGNFYLDSIIFSYDEAIKLDPKYKEAWYSKGNVFYD